MQHKYNKIYNYFNTNFTIDKLNINSIKQLYPLSSIETQTILYNPLKTLLNALFTTTHALDDKRNNLKYNNDNTLEFFTIFNDIPMSFTFDLSDFKVYCQLTDFVYAYTTISNTISNTIKKFIYYFLKGDLYE